MHKPGGIDIFRVDAVRFSLLSDLSGNVRKSQFLLCFYAFYVDALLCVCIYIAIFSKYTCTGPREASLA